MISLYQERENQRKSLHAFSKRKEFFNKLDPPQETSFRGSGFVAMPELEEFWVQRDQQHDDDKW